jgi:FMN reductase
LVYRPTVVGLSGSLSRPSRTTALVAAIVEGIAARESVETTLVELADDAPHLFAARARRDLAGRSRAIVEVVEAADLLVVGTPVYRASYTGALKHLFDLVDHRRFAGKPVVLAATGGTLMHGLVLEHAMRPLFGFLGALTLPTTVYAVEGDFAGFTLASSKVRDRALQAADEASRHLRADLRHIEATRQAANGGASSHQNQGAGHEHVVE